MNPDPAIGRRQFTDGTTREVFADDEGQYVLDDDETARRSAACGFRPMTRWTGR